MKYTLKNKPKKHGCVSSGGRWEEYSECEVDKRFEGFEKELREKLATWFQSYTPDEVRDAWIECLSEVLGDEP